MVLEAAEDGLELLWKENTKTSYSTAGLVKFSKKWAEAQSWFNLFDNVFACGSFSIEPSTPLPNAKLNGTNLEVSTRRVNFSGLVAEWRT